MKDDRTEYNIYYTFSMYKLKEDSSPDNPEFDEYSEEVLIDVPFDILMKTVTDFCMDNYCVNLDGTDNSIWNLFAGTNFIETLFEDDDFIDAVTENYKYSNYAEEDYTDWIDNLDWEGTYCCACDWEG